MGLDNPVERDHPDQIAKAIVEAVRGQSALADFQKHADSLRQISKAQIDAVTDLVAKTARLTADVDVFLQKAEAAGVYDPSPDAAHFHDNLDARWGEMTERTGRFRRFYHRFLEATKAHDFIADPGQRAAHSDLKALIWQVRHAAEPEDFDRLLDQAEAALTALCAMAGIREPSDPDPDFEPAVRQAVAEREGQDDDGPDY